MNTCKVCGKTPIIGRGMCRNHYMADWRKRIKKGHKPGLKPIMERLLEGRKIASNGCWEWRGAHKPEGYGLIMHKGITWRVHRLMYVLTHGRELPKNIFICHQCDNPKCFNPSHLFEGTNEINLKDAAEKNRFPLGIKHWNAKLSNKQISAIKRSVKSNGELAAKYGVHPSYISRVKSGIRRSKSNK